ncbi:MAG: ABC transporter permease [Treponema sp.]|nr:ABC transporter permease [Treponema sp.]MCL2252028.1 ABC transporter permease [Treponema sp.]
MKLNREIKIGSCLIFIILVMQLVSLIWSPYNFNEINHDIRLLSPNSKHLLGTDHLGRDIFSRIMAGGLNSLLLAVCTVTCAAVIGCLLGLFAGFLGGTTDVIILRVIDILNSFPGIILALFMVAILDNSHFSLFFALLLVFIPSYTRIIRTGALQYKNYDFIKAEIILGANFFRITFIHILPNLFPSLLSASILGLSNAILAESAMSYLGMGIQPPNPSWGRMLFEAQSWFFNAPWYALAPGIFITLTVIAFHFLGEGLRRLHTPSLHNQTLQKNSLHLRRT